jgi:hypothetical protein
LVLVTAGLLAGPHLAEARAAGGPGEKTVIKRLTPRSLGLPAGAPKRTVALAALDRHRRTFELGSGRELRVTGERSGAVALEQQVQGVPVLWSRIGVSFRGSSVTALHGLTVPVRGLRTLPRKRIGARRAEEIARAERPEPAHVTRTRLVIAAGAPGKPRARARLGYLVQVDADAKADPLCVVVDAVTGAVLTTYRGSVAPALAERGAEPKAPASDRPLAHAAATTTQTTSLALIFDGKGANAFDNNNSGIKFAWGWNVTRPVPSTGAAPPFTAFDMLYNANYKRSWNGAYVGNDEVDNKVAVWAKQYNEWQCSANAWCSANGLKGGMTYPWKVVANHSPVTSVGAGSLSRGDTAYVAAGDGLTADITAHELGHLRYEHQLGGSRNDAKYVAVDEAMADIGEFLFYEGKQPILSKGAINPRQPGYRNNSDLRYADSLKNYYCGPLDGGGQHFNSTIITRAFVDFYDRTSYGIARGMYNTLLWSWLSQNSDVRSWFSSFEAALITSYPSYRAQGEAAQKLVGFDPTKPSPKLPC